MTSTSPLIGCHTYWNASAVPQMSAPAPLMLNTPLLTLAPPATPTAPISWDVHGAGKADDAADTVMVTGGDVVVAPRLSTARAVSV